jgi:hypothetical protein
VATSSGSVRIQVESRSGERFEAEVPAQALVSTVAADFFESQGWPLRDGRGRPVRAVVELVDPASAGGSKRLNGDLTVREAGLTDDDLLRVFPEPAAGGASGVGRRAQGIDLVDTETRLRETIEAWVRATLKEALQKIDFRPALHPIFRGHGFELDRDLCFVIMPFGPQELQIAYQDHIRPVLERCGLRVQRGDDLYTAGPIIEDVWATINKARLVVADLTGRNPNVFYEVGICHTLGKPVVMLTQRMEDVPFDLRHLRVISYEYTPRGCKLLESALEKAVKGLPEPGG